MATSIVTVVTDKSTLPDQPNRAVRTRMLRGVGGGAARLLPIPMDVSCAFHAVEIELDTEFQTASVSCWINSIMLPESVPLSNLDCKEYAIFSKGQS